MKQLVSSLIAVFIAAPAVAADMPNYQPYMLPAVASWDGAYVGLSLGARWTDSTWTTTGIGSPLGTPDATTTPTSFSSTSFRPGGFVGYNWQWAPMGIIGVEADAAWGRNNDTVAGIPGTYGTGGQGVGPGATASDSAAINLGWDGSLRARLGVVVAPTWLVYATGGLAWQQASFSATCNGSLFNNSWCVAARNESYSTTLIGWTVGGGVEALLWNNWFVRAEYRYADYGDVSHTFFSGTNIDEVAMQASVRTNTALIGVGYKF